MYQIVVEQCPPEKTLKMRLVDVLSKERLEEAH